MNKKKEILKKCCTGKGGVIKDGFIPPSNNFRLPVKPNINPMKDGKNPLDFSQKNSSQQSIQNKTPVKPTSIYPGRVSRNPINKPSPVPMITDPNINKGNPFPNYKKYPAITPNNIKKRLIDDYTTKNKITAQGKGGPIGNLGKSLKRGMLNIGNNAIEGATSAYKSNMAQYKKESGINKTDPIDNLKAGIKGLMGGTLGVVKGMGENAKSHIDKIKSMVSPEKEAKKGLLKKAIKKEFPTSKKFTKVAKVVDPKPVKAFKNLGDNIAAEK